MDYQTADAIDSLILTGTSAGLAIAAASGAAVPLTLSAGGALVAAPQSLTDQIAAHPIVWLGGAALIVWAFMEMK